MPSLTLEFWGWEEPVLQKAVSYLAALPDFSSTLILVPTAEASRRLREGLAIHAAVHEGAVSLPYVWHPEIALTWEQDRDKLASRCEERLAWSTVLKRVRRGGYPALFPVLPESVSSTWAMNAADTLVSLKQLLGAGGHNLATAAAALKDHDESERWADLARIEAEYLTALDRLSLKDQQEAKRLRAEQPRVPEGITQILVFAVADPPALLRQWFSQVSERIPVRIFVQAPELLADGFDAWGLPQPEVWAEAAPRFHRDLPDDAILLVPRPQDQARSAVGLLRDLLKKGIPSVIGACDPALGAHLESALAAEDVRAYNPADKLALEHCLVAMIRSWISFSQTRAWKPMVAFLRQDDVLRALTSGRDDLSATKLLSSLDVVFTTHLPPTLEDALQLLSADEYPALRAVLETVQTHLIHWQNPTAPSSDKSDLSEGSHSSDSPASCESSLRDLLTWIYGATVFKTHLEADAEMARLLGETISIASTLDAASQALGATVPVEDLQLLLLAELEQITLSDTRGEVDMVLHGWLEMLWDSAPGLILTGFNEENVPGVTVSHAFLPDSLRRRLGLSSQLTRRSRDAYLLAAMIEQRRKTGSVQVVLGRTDEESNALKPSRLLFNCTDDALPRRIERLFPTHAEAREDPEPPWRQAWPLRPRLAEPHLNAISVSAIKSYLACPFRYYLEKVLHMGAVDAGQRELREQDFGKLVHDVLAAYGKSELSRKPHSVSAITAWIDDCLIRLARRRYGERPFFTVALQLESARRRLGAICEDLALLQEDGWRVQEPELEISAEWGLLLEGVPFKGRIDRLDVRKEPEGLVYRIWDYKTGATQTKPFTEVRGKHKADPSQDWKCFVWNQKKYRWNDPQLSLYTWAVRHRYPEAVRVEAGYFWMPPTGDIKYQVDEEASAQDVVDAALDLGETVVRGIRSGEFWPPAAGTKRDNFAELWLGKNPADVVDDSWLGS